MKRLILRLGLFGIFLAGFVGVLVWNPVPPFLLKEIVVTPSPTRLSERDLVSLAEVRKGDHLLTLSLGQVRKNLLRSPWVREVSLAKAYPSRLVISVVEEEPVALLRLEDLYLVNRDGRPFKKVSSGDPKNLPILSGPKRGEKGKVRQMLRLVGIFQRHEVLRPIGISEVRWNSKGGAEILTLRPVVRVLVGKEKWEERLQNLPHVLSEFERRQAKPGVVDLTYDQRIFIKEKV